MGAFKQEQGRAGRAGPPGNFGPQSLLPVWQGCRLAFRKIGACREFRFFGPPGPWFGCPVRLPIRLRHAVSALGLARSAPVCSSRAGAPAVRGASRPAPSPRPAFARVSGGAARFRFWLSWRPGIAAHSEAQPGAQADAGCALGFVADISAAPLSSGVGRLGWSVFWSFGVVGCGVGRSALITDQTFKVTLFMLRVGHARVCLH